MFFKRHSHSEIVKRCSPSLTYDCRGNASSYCRYAFHLFDRDNNGTLSFTEFAVAMQIYTSTDLEDMLSLV